MQNLLGMLPANASERRRRNRVANQLSISSERGVLFVAHVGYSITEIVSYNKCSADH